MFMFPGCIVQNEFVPPAVSIRNTPVVLLSLFIIFYSLSAEHIIQLFSVKTWQMEIIAFETIIDLADVKKT